MASEAEIGSRAAAALARQVREARLLAAEAAVSGDRRIDAERFRTAFLPHAEYVLVNASAAAEEDAQLQRALLSTVTRLEGLGGSGSDGEHARALDELAALLGRDDEGEDVIALLGDPTLPPPVLKAPPERCAPPADRLVERLGQPATTYQGSQVRAVPGERSVPATSPWAGRQLQRPGAAPRISRGYTHHGIAMPEGTVTHYAGEPGVGSDAGVRRDSFEAFLEPARLEDARFVRPVAILGRPIRPLLPSVVCMRALSRVGERRYHVFTNNCEHFAMWSQLGASFSSQTHLADQLACITSGAPELQAIGSQWLEEAVTLEREPIEVAPPNGTPDTPVELDLARAFWSPDLHDIVVWMPLWSGGLAASGLADHAWRAGGIGEGDWAFMPPAVTIEPSWHASLIGHFPAEGTQGGTPAFTWWTTDGRAFNEGALVLEIVETRLRDVQRVLAALGDGLIESLAILTGLSP